MILIVDDRQENIFSLKTVLEQHGFETDAASSGEEALKKLLKNDYALIILDVQMPEMDGFEVAEAITGLNKTKDIPIIFLSAVNTHKRFISRGFETGAVDYLTKPVDPDILFLKVRNFYQLSEKTRALKEAEKSLAITVSELRSTLESLPQLAFTANKKGSIELVNKHWFEFSTSKDAFPQSVTGHPALQELWLTAVTEGKAIEQEVCIKKITDGQYYFHLLRATPVISNGSISKWVGTFTSIHEQKLHNEQLERKVAERTHELLEINRELEITNNDLQQFTSVASHDLKEPLRKIQFFGSMIKEKGHLEGTNLTYLEKILQSSKRMSNLISDLLTFTKLSQPDLYQLTDINQIFEEIFSDLELSIEEKKAQIKMDAIPKLEVIPSLIRQLFQNIISNALKFSKEDETPVITITADRTDTPDIESAAKPEGFYCRLRIEDNGIGFDERYAHKIFTLFQRLNARTEYEGTGIGLAIAKKIIDRHNGLIVAKSIPGTGSVFYTLLPVTQDQLHKRKEENKFTATQL